MAATEQIVLAFDLYGTLVSTDYVATLLAKWFGGEKPKDLSRLWRRYQLEYTWRCNSMKTYIPFSTITRRSLRHALGDLSLNMVPGDIDALLEAYDGLPTFDGVAELLEQLAKEPSFTPVVFSNGTNRMLANLLKHSEGLAQHADVFKNVISMEEVQRFKPDPDVYYFLAKKLGKDISKGELNKIWLISGNPFDVVGAKAVGMRTCWVDRERKGWTDRLVGDDEGRPDVIVHDLLDIIEQIKSYVA